MLSLLNCFFIFLMGVTQAQDGKWRAITSLNQTDKIVYTPSHGIWAISAGGLYQYRNGSVNAVITPVEGMYRLQATTIHYLQSQDLLMLGYSDGMMDLFDPETATFRSLSDIFRVTTFPSKVIRTIVEDGTSVYVSTDFGIVIYDTESFLVRDSITKIGTFERGIPVRDLTVTDTEIYVATPEGFAIASLSSNLKEESSWQSFDASNSVLENGISSFEIWQTGILATDGLQNFRFVDGVWSEFVLSDQLSAPADGFARSRTGEYLSAVSGETILVISQDGSVQLVPTDAIRVEDALYLDLLSEDGGDVESDRIYTGTLDKGLGVCDPQTGECTYPIPSGPRLNFFDGLMFDEDVLITGTTQRSQRDELLDNAKGYAIFRDGNWENYHRQNNDQLNDARYRQAFTTTANDEYYYFGSWGRGIVRHHKQSGEIEVFNAGNSLLRGWAADNDQFVVITGLMADKGNNVWATSRFATEPLYVQQAGEDSWIPYPKPEAMQFGDEVVDLFIDSNDQKWITLQSVTTAGRGLLVVDTGAPGTIGDMQSVKLTDDSGGGNLPDMKVNAIVEDRNGEIWVGTERGVARYLFPQFVITGSVLERTAQWLINADPEAENSFLLRDIQVSSMAVNPANQKWIGTVNNGLWLINSEGNRVLAHFTSENSPLLSDGITDLEVNSKTGELYIATDAGLMVYQDLPVDPVGEMNRLKAYPNPFRSDRHDQIVIEGLSDQTTIRILTTDGQLIQQIENRGGTASWNGKDARGEQVASGVYVIVALSPDGKDRGVGKIVVIR